MVKGLKPYESLLDRQNTDVKNMTYSELVSFMENNPDFKLE